MLTQESNFWRYRIYKEQAAAKNFDSMMLTRPINDLSGSQRLQYKNTMHPATLHHDDASISPGYRSLLMQGYKEVNGILVPPVPGWLYVFWCYITIACRVR
jgi:hypothetical protein